MNRGFPKQFLELSGQPVIIKTLLCFLEYNPSIKIIISVHPHYLLLLNELIERSGLPSENIQVTTGGGTRFDSVKNGLKLVSDEKALIAIHDAARPFVSQQTIKNCFEAAALYGNAVPTIPISESLRKTEGKKNVAVNREDYLVIQTPQCFLSSKIKRAYEQPYKAAFTDDATVLEMQGETIHLVEGNVENIKLTTPNDLLIAKVLFDHEQRRHH